MSQDPADAPETTCHLGATAVVIGASMAGLCAARVVSEHFAAVVVIDSVDLQDQTVVYRMEDGMKARRYVENRELLRGLRPGDRVEVLGHRG